jgi:hypothetical protein
MVQKIGQRYYFVSGIILILSFLLSKPMLGSQAQSDNSKKPNFTPPGWQKLDSTLQKLFGNQIANRHVNTKKDGTASESLVAASVTFSNLDASANAWLKGKFPNTARSRTFENITTLSGNFTADELQKLINLPQVQAIRSLAVHGPYDDFDELVTADSDSPAPSELPLIRAADVHKALAAHAAGYIGTGVTVAIVDSGVDFGTPDMQGTQARVSSGDYVGWPFAYNVQSATYASNANYVIKPSTYSSLVGQTWLVGTEPVVSPSCTATTCTATLNLLTAPSTVSRSISWPNTSLSGTYYYSIHPDPQLKSAASSKTVGYSASAPAAIIVSDEALAGKYDSVYIDVDFSGVLTSSEVARKYDGVNQTSELVGADLWLGNGSTGSDGYWDLSAGMLSWIADGTHRVPGLNVLYPTSPIPANGRLLSFIGETTTNHGTRTASSVVAQGVITDPYLQGDVNPHLAGGALVGGVGGIVLKGTAPGARIAVMMNGFNDPISAWTLVAYGFDGIPNSGDEAQVVNNSWAVSTEVTDGWDIYSRFVQSLNYGVAPNITFLASTGNGGHGYGTVAAPAGGTIIDVGASTSYGNLKTPFEFSGADQMTWGDVQGWSQRGPTMLGEIAPDVLAVGAWATAANGLNQRLDGNYNGQRAYVRFSGTSQSTPLAAGVVALAYQAYKTRTGQWPTWQQATDFLINGAEDLGHDPVSQGAGNVDALQTARIAAGLVAYPELDNGQWRPGDYQGTYYPLFPAVLSAGQSNSKTFTVRNPSSSAATLNFTAEVLTKAHVEDYSYNFGVLSAYTDTVPTYVSNLNTLVSTYQPDLIRAEIAYDFADFDLDNNKKWTASDAHWRVFFYDWKDLNSDGNLWTDTNSNGHVDSGEIDTIADPLGPSSVRHEQTIINYGRNYATITDATVGKDTLNRLHDGLFWGLQCRAGCNDSTPPTIKVRLTFYKRQTWSWLNLSTNSLTVPTNSTATLNATLNVPSDTRPGFYQGAIYYNQSGREQLLPVAINITGGAGFEFGATSLSQPQTDEVYPNGHLVAGFDWRYRWESGDWRQFFYSVPALPANSSRAVVVDTQWSGAKTDIDSWVYGANPNDSYALANPAAFGPTGLSLIANSKDTFSNYGSSDVAFSFQTNTGGSREVVSGSLPNAGLGLIALHNVLNQGSTIGEAYTGKVYQLQTNPANVDITTSTATGNWTQTLAVNLDLSDGLQHSLFGLNIPQSLTAQSVAAGGSSNPCTASSVWYQAQDLTNAGLLQVTTSSSSTGLDVDLFVYRDDGNNIFNCSAETLVGQSAGSTAAENIQLIKPSNGRYWIVVLGYSVPSGSAFDITINAIQGTAVLSSGSFPSAPVSSGSYPFVINYDLSSFTAPTTLRGILFLGSVAAPNALQVPITIRYLATATDTPTATATDTPTATATNTPTATATDTPTATATNTPTATATDTPTATATNTLTATCDQHADRDCNQHTDCYRYRHADRDCYQYTDCYRHRYADCNRYQHADRYCDRYADCNRYRYADRHCYQHADCYRDQHADRDCNQHTDCYRYRHADCYCDLHADCYRHRYADRDCYQYADRDCYQYADCYRDQYTNCDCDQHADCHRYRYTNCYRDQHADRHCDLHADRHCYQYTDCYRYRYADCYCNQYANRDCYQHTNANRYRDQHADCYSDRTATNIHTVPYKYGHSHTNKHFNGDFFFPTYR